MASGTPAVDRGWGRGRFAGMVRSRELGRALWARPFDVMMGVIVVVAAVTNGHGTVGVVATSDAPAIRIRDGELQLPEIIPFNRFEHIFRNPLTDMKYRSNVDRARRRRLFQANVAVITAHNRRESMGKETFRMGINQFSDMTAEEFQQWNGYQPTRERQTISIDGHSIDPIPSSIDWREKGAVTPVKNQGSCGSCWAFATTGTMEGAYQISTGALRSLSEQQLVDCSTAEGNKGCGGGNFNAAFTYIENHTGVNGLDSEKDYPYTAMNGECWLNATKRVVATVSSYVDIPVKDEAALVAAVSKGPVAVAIEADQAIFQNYKSGVITNATACGTKLDHGVLIVGYTPTYWIVKNSWGNTYGLQGYVHIGRGAANAEGVCGINLDPTQAISNATSPVPVPSPTPGPPPGLPCNCTTHCEAMCNQFGMICCNGSGGNCDCSPAASCPSCQPKSNIEEIIIAGNTNSAYRTNFAALPADWTQDEGCTHCSKRGGDECTRMTANATSFGIYYEGSGEDKAYGMRHTTTHVSTASNACKAGAASGHLTWNRDVLYGNFTVVARWFPGNKANVSSATGFIGLDSPGNEASITMGFHGDGWPENGEGSHKYQHGIYSDVKKNHNRGYTETGDNVSLSEQFNTFGLLWTADACVWSLNGKEVRRFTDTTNIPHVSMKLRLHTRSGYVSMMPSALGSSFMAEFLSFEYQPVSTL